MLKTIEFTVHIKEGRISSASKVSKLAAQKTKKIIMALRKEKGGENRVLFPVLCFS